MWIGDRRVEDSAAFVGSRAIRIWRSRWCLLAWMLLCAGAGLAYCLASKPEFIAKVDILLEPRRLADDGPEDLRHYHQVALDSEQADTQIRVIRSELLLRPIFDQWRLSRVAELADGQDGFWSWAAHRLHPLSPMATPHDEETRAFYTFVDRVRCLRLGLSYVIELSYRSRDPNRAARIANAIAAAYVADRLVRMQVEVQRAGGPYRADRADELLRQLAETRGAMARGEALSDAIPYGDIRLLGQAVPPLTKSYPKTVPTLLFAAGFGTISGVFLVMFGLAPTLAPSAAIGGFPTAAGARELSLKGSGRERKSSAGR